MTGFEEKLSKSIELAKSGFDNAQARIAAIDTKVGIAVGLLIVLLPVPLAIVGWALSLEATTSANIYAACSRCRSLSSLAAGFLLWGMFCAFMAIVRGISCLTPRGPKGYGKCGPFQNEWHPNVLFPLHKPDNVEQFCGHLRRLHDGVDLSFLINEYDHQLQQLGRILHLKFVAMGQCFWWLNICLASYGVATLAATMIAVSTLLFA